MESNEIFKKLSKKIFGKEVYIPKEFNNYINLLEICRNIEGIKGENNLLLTLFEIIFLENGKPRTQIDPNLIRCYKLCLEDNLEDAYLKYYVNNTETQLVDCLKNENIFSKNDFRLLAFITKIKKILPYSLEASKIFIWRNAKSIYQVKIWNLYFHKNHLRITYMIFLFFLIY